MKEININKNEEGSILEISPIILLSSVSGKCVGGLYVHAPVCKVHVRSRGRRWTHHKHQQVFMIMCVFYKSRSG